MNRPLPNVPVDEQGLRQLEIWLLGQLQTKIKQMILKFGGEGIQFNKDNEGGWLDVTANDTDPSSYGIYLKDESGGGMGIKALDGGGIDIEGEWVTLVGFGGGDPLRGVNIFLKAGVDGAQIESADAGAATVLRVVTAEGVTGELQTGEAFKIKNSVGGTVFEVDENGTITPAGAGGVSSIKKTGSTALTGNVTLTGGTGITLTESGQDISIAASGSSGIAFATGNSGTYLDITTTSRDGTSHDGIKLHDTGGTSLGIQLTSDSGSIYLDSPGGVRGTAVASDHIFEADGATFFIGGALSDNNIVCALDTGGDFKVTNALGGSVYLKTSDSTGITTGHFDGGSA